jgi:uncharacterized protein (DUF2336 family)
MQSSAHQSMIRELELSIRDGTPSQRISTLRRVTDLFISGAERFDEEQVRLFDHVIARLAVEIEKTALAELSSRLAPISNAPVAAVRALASDDAIVVAAPVLVQSERLGEADLVEIARTKSQAHLLAISGRARLGEAVTDVLVERGDDEVARRVAGNGGASFSELGFSHLVERAGTDDALAETVGQRIDIPPYLFQKLVTRATERVLELLLSAARPEMRVAIEHLLSEISYKVRARSELASRSYSAARSYVQMLSQSGRLGVPSLLEFARAGRFAETVAALAEIALVPIEIVDRVMYGDTLDPCLILCKAKEFDWSTVRALILVRRGCRTLSPQELARICEDYSLLSRSTADRALRFWQIRQGGDERPAVSVAGRG